MFSKKAIRIICLVTAIAMVVPICIGVAYMFMGINQSFIIGGEL